MLMMIRMMLCGLVLLVTACVPHTTTLRSVADPPAELKVQAQATIEVAPDQLQLHLGVVTHAAEAQTALDDNNRRMTALIERLRRLGIHDDDLATGQFQVRPEWSLPPRPTPANWQREIIGYRVTNELSVTTARLELAGRLLTLAQRAGANQIGGLQFSLADPEEVRQRAIDAATVRARQRARTLATAAGVTLGPVRSLTLEAENGGRVPRIMLAEARSANGDAVPLAAGKISVAARVIMVFAVSTDR